MFISVIKQLLEKPTVAERYIKQILPLSKLFPQALTEFDLIAWSEGDESFASRAYAVCSSSTVAANAAFAALAMMLKFTC